MLLGRLGHELAHIYHDTLQAPLPAALRALIERLDAALEPAEEARPQPASVSECQLR